MAKNPAYLGPQDHPEQVQSSGWNRRKFLQSTAAVVAAASVMKSAVGAEESAPAAGPGRDPLFITEHPEIIRNRDSALAILKPTPAELERGLSLHRRSLVFDSYGFSPRVALDGKAVADAEAAGATDAELQDLREEMSMTRAVFDARERSEFQAAMQAAGVTCIFQNAGEESSDPLVLIKRLARFTYLGDHLRDILVRAATPDDIEAAKKAGVHCLYLTGNGVPLAQKYSTVDEELGFIRIFYQLGIRMMHVTYNRRNLLGDGCAEPANGGLSDLGRAAIAEMNRVGVIVDVAHSGWKTSLEAAKASTKPMVASHTVCAAIRNHIRAKPDEVIRAICDTGGLVGICCIPPFLGGEGDITALLDHIDHVVKKFGVDHVAIGTDISFTSRNVAAENKLVKSRGKRKTRYEALWPEGALGGNWPKQSSIAWTNWPLYTVGLVQRGYSDEEIQKIIGGNVMRVCRDVLK